MQVPERAGETRLGRSCRVNVEQRQPPHTRTVGTGLRIKVSGTVIESSSSTTMNRRRGLLARAREARIPIKRARDRLTISARLVCRTDFQNEKILTKGDKYE